MTATFQKVRWLLGLALVTLYSASGIAITAQQAAGEYVATTRITSIESATLKKMGDDFSEAEFRKMIEGTFDPFLIAATNGSGIRVTISKDAKAAGTISGNAIQFKVVLDPEVVLVYEGAFSDDQSVADGTMYLKTPVGRLLKGTFHLQRKGTASLSVTSTATTPATAPIVTSTPQDTQPPESQEIADSEKTADVPSRQVSDAEYQEVAQEMRVESDSAVEERQRVPLSIPFDPVLPETNGQLIEAHGDRVQTVRNALDAIATETPGITVQTDIAGRTVLSQSDNPDSVTQKVIRVLSDKDIEENVAKIPQSELFKNTLVGVIKDVRDGKAPDATATSKSLITETAEAAASKGLEKAGMGGGAIEAGVKEFIRDQVDNPEDSCAARAKSLHLNEDEARMSCIMDKYDDNIGDLKYVKTGILETTGEVVKKVSSGLDFMGNKKRVMLARAAAAEYEVFKNAYQKSRQELWKEPIGNAELVRRSKAAAVAALKAYKDDELNAYQSSWQKWTSYFSSDKNAVDHTLLDRDSAFPSVTQRCGQYLALLRKDNLI